MISYENSFVYLRTGEGRTTIAWLGPVAESNAFYVVYLGEGPGREPQSEEFQDPDRIVKDKQPSDTEVKQFWREYRANPYYKSDLQCRMPEFRGAYLDYRNRNRAGGRF